MRVPLWFIADFKLKNGNRTGISTSTEVQVSSEARPRTFWRTQPSFHTDSTIRAYSCVVPVELRTLTERMNMMDDVHHNSQHDDNPTITIIR